MPHPNWYSRISLFAFYTLAYFQSLYFFKLELSLIVCKSSNFHSLDIINYYLLCTCISFKKSIAQRSKGWARLINLLWFDEETYIMLSMVQIDILSNLTTELKWSFWISWLCFVLQLRNFKELWLHIQLKCIVLGLVLYVNMLK